METGNFTYKVKSAAEKEIFLHLNECSNNFTPPLSDRTDLASYAKKLFENAETFEAWNGDRLIGLIAGYFSKDETKTFFISNVSVIKEYSGKGIASRLLKDCISCCKENDYFVLTLEVNRHNSPAVAYYKKYRFRQYESKGDQLFLKLELKNEL
jgi:ribosomal protein S18 acetylase RimI-like enzyme